VVFLCPGVGRGVDGGAKKPQRNRKETAKKLGRNWEEKGNKWLRMVQSGEKWSKVVFVLKSGGI